MDMKSLQAMRQVMKELSILARDTNACVLVLHHTKEGAPRYPCQPRSALQGMVSSDTSNGIDSRTDDAGTDAYLCVAPVKNRYGKADHTGSTYISLSFDPASMYLEDVVRDYRQVEMKV
jgi:hypothetical protein